MINTEGPRHHRHAVVTISSTSGQCLDHEEGDHLVAWESTHHHCQKDIINVTYYIVGNNRTVQPNVWCPMNTRASSSSLSLPPGRHERRQQGPIISSTFPSLPLAGHHECHLSALSGPAGRHLLHYDQHRWSARRRPRSIAITIVVLVALSIFGTTFLLHALTHISPESFTVHMIAQNKDTPP